MTAMSNLVMARIRPLNGPLLAAAEQHGRRLDEAAIRRKVRDDPSLTWVPEGIEEDPLALSDRLADHVAGAMVPKAKTKALHMLVKLPASVPVETEADARAALDLVVQFAQDTTADGRCSRRGWTGTSVRCTASTCSSRPGT